MADVIKRIYYNQIGDVDCTGIYFISGSSSVYQLGEVRYNLDFTKIPEKVKSLIISGNISRIANTTGKSQSLLGVRVDVGEYAWIDKTGAGVVTTSPITNIGTFMSRYGTVYFRVDKYCVQYTTGGNGDYRVYFDAPAANTTYVDITCEVPIVTNSIQDGSYFNPSTDIPLMWSTKYSDNADATQISYTLEHKVGTSGTVSTLTGTSSTKQAIIPGGTLGSGQTIYYRVKSVVKGEVESDFSAWTTINTYVAPTISTLEPNGVNQNRDKDILATWSATNYHAFRLEVLKGTTLISTYTGANQAQFLIPKNTIPSGNVKLKLTLTYNGVGYTTTSIKEVEFLAYGAPNAPVQDNTEVFNTALPIFTWVSTEQVSYDLQLLKGAQSIISTGEVLGTSKSYTVANPLENNTDYTIKIRVKNQFNLWSTWSEKFIRVEFTELPKPTFEILASGNSAVLNITNTDHVLFLNSEVWRRESGKSIWTRLAYSLGRVTTYTDHTLKNNTLYDYKVRSLSTDGAVSESVVKSTSINITGFEFVNVEDWDNTWTKYNQVGEKSIEVSVNRKRNVVASIYAGNTGATIETDGISYRELSFSMELSYNQYDSLLEMINESKVMLFRDERGHKCYGYVTSDIPEEHIEFNGYKTGFTFTEVNFIEQDMYKGDGGMVLVYLDGKYKLDGSLPLTGVKVL